MIKEISVPAVEFIDVLQRLDLLDIVIDVEHDTVKQMIKLVDDIENEIDRNYYKGVTEKWLQQFEKSEITKWD